MNAEEAKRKSLQNQKKNEAFQHAIHWTDDNIKTATEKGKRQCVLVCNDHRIKSTVIQHYREKGFEVGQFKPPQITYYLRW